MPAAKLVLVNHLDPRPREQALAAPLADAANIPLELLASLTHALPPAEQVVPVLAAEPLAAETLRVLASLQRQGRRAGRGERAPQFVNGRLWRPNEYLESRLALMDPGAGPALDLACGTGREAVYLAACGWEVEGVDVLPDAVSRAAALLNLHFPGAAPPAAFRVLDLERDNVDLPNGHYGLITGFRYLHRPLFAQLKRWLRPGGHVVYETFTTLHRQHRGRPQRDAFVLQPGELRDLLREFELLDYQEGWHGVVHTARAHALSRP